MSTQIFNEDRRAHQKDSRQPQEGRLELVSSNCDHANGAGIQGKQEEKVCENS